MFLKPARRHRSIAWLYRAVVAGAVSGAADFHPHLLIVDYMLQDEITGLELLQRLREQSGDIESILISGYPSLELREEARRAGVVAFLEKPFGLDELRTATRRATAPLHNRG